MATFSRLGGLGLILVLLLAGCQEPTAPPRHQSKGVLQARSLPQVEFRNLRYEVHEQGQKAWVVTARGAQIYRNHRIFMQQVTVVSPGQKVEILADQATYYLLTKQFLFEGHVRLKTAKHGILETSKLWYLPKERLLKSSCPVKIWHGTILMEGKGFVYDLRTGTLKILHQSKVQVGS